MAKELVVAPSLNDAPTEFDVCACLFGLAVEYPHVLHAVPPSLP